MSVAQEYPTLLDEFTEFLTSFRTPTEIISWRPSEAVQERFAELSLRNSAGTLTRDEQAELNNAVQTEMMLRLLKAKIQIAAANKHP